MAEWKQVLTQLQKKGVTEKEDFVIGLMQAKKCTRDYAVRTVRKFMNGVSRKHASPTKQTLRTMSMDKLIDDARLDARKILRQAIDAMPEGECASDDTLRRDLQISPEQWRALRDADEFSACQVKIRGGRRYWARRATCERLLKFDGVGRI